MYNRIVGVKGEKKNEKNMEAKTVIGTAFDLYGTGNDRGFCLSRGLGDVYKRQM